MWTARLIGTNIEVKAFKLDVAYKRIKEIGGDKCRISMRFHK